MDCFEVYTNYELDHFYVIALLKLIESLFSNYRKFK